MLYRFPLGFEKRPDLAPGSIDEVQMLDGAAEVTNLRDGRLPRGCGMVVRGWTFDPIAREPAARVVLTVDDRINAEPVYGAARPDIAKDFDKPSLEQTGFKGIVSSGSLPLGRHELKMYVVDADSQYYESPATYGFEVVPSAAQLPILPTVSASEFAAEIEELSPTAGGIGPRLVPRGAILVVRGFAFDLQRNSPCKAVYVKIGEECTRAVYGVPRETLPESDGGPDAKFSGFTARFNTGVLAAGTHEIQLLAVSSNGSGIAEVGPRPTVQVSTLSAGAA
jgi:hypothetical protein